MDYSALNQAVDNANQMNNTTMWIMFTIFVIVPLLFAFIYVPVAIIEQRRNLKCPKCGNWRRNKSTMQTVGVTNDSRTTVTTQRAVTCVKCRSEFTS